MQGTQGPDSSASGRADRVLMLGLDGAAWTWLGSPLVRETMPSLISFLDTTNTGDLASTIPCYTGPAWTTITTGLDPGRHGIFGFTDRNGRPNTNSDVGAPRVWDYVGKAGGRSLVVNVPLTFPVRPIDGTIVAGMPVPPGVPYASPASVMDELNELAGGHYVNDVALMGSPSVSRTCAALTTMTDARRKLLNALVAREAWDLVAVVFVMPDRLGHPWWKYLVPGDPLYDTPEGEETRKQAEAPLRALDHAIDDLLAAQPPNTSVVLCSDHGFGPLDTDIFFDVELAAAGLITAGTSSKLGRRMAQAGRTKVARLLPRSVVDKVKSTVNVARDRRAWTGPTYEQAVYLEEPDDALRNQVTELLSKLRSPEGLPLVTAIRSREELFHGHLVDRAPDLFPQMTQESIQLHEGMHATQAWMSRENLPWGTHARAGVVALDHKGARKNLDGAAADITPTLLALLGYGVPNLDGTSLVEADVTEIEALTPVDEGQGLTAGEEEAVMEHLKGLGYVE